MPRWNNPNCGYQKGHASYLTEEAKAKIGKAQKGVKKSEETKRNMSAGRLGKKLSIKHRLAISNAKKGDKTNLWKGGLSQKNKLVRDSAEYKIWRTEVFQRDDYTCVFCGIRGGRLNADHIKPFALYPDLRFDIQNGRTLCESCHKKTDTYGWNFYHNKGKRTTMLTTDKTITTREYWAKVYTGKNDNAKVDASNTVRPANPFDRFSWVAQYAEGLQVLGVASGHAHIEKRIKALHPDWKVVASDQTKAAKEVANYSPYLIMDAYNIQLPGKLMDTIICCQAMEYMDDQDRFLKEAQRVARKLLITVPIGEMAKWSQLRIYTEENVRELLATYGTIEVFERHDDLLLVKLKFND